MMSTNERKSLEIALAPHFEHGIWETRTMNDDVLASIAMRHGLDVSDKMQAVVARERSKGRPEWGI